MFLVFSEFFVQYLLLTPITVKRLVYRLLLLFPGFKMSICFFKFAPDVKNYIYYQLYTEDSLLADIGGYLGLFLGLSVFSIFEILFCFSEHQVRQAPTQHSKMRWASPKAQRPSCRPSFFERKWKKICFILLISQFLSTNWHDFDA